MDYQVGYVWSDGKIITQSLGLIVRGTSGGQVTETQINIMSKYVYEEGSNTPYAAMFMNGEYLLVKNAQGDVTAIVNSENGETLVEYQYDPWGQVTSTYCGADDDEATKNLIMTIVNSVCPLTYRGYNYDFTTGLYYLQSRYYNPEWGRFLNVDDVKILASSADDKSSVTALSANPYLYCNNNPINRVDYTGYRQTLNPGQSFSEWIGNLIGTLIILGPFLVDETYKNYFEYEKKDLLCKVAIRTDKTNFLNAILQCATINRKLTYQILALFIDQRIQEKMNRHILFSDDCMADEIEWHVEMYIAQKDVLYESANNPQFPFKFTFINYYFYKHCEVVNIDERDVYDSKQANMFNYSEEIRECYYGNLADPFVRTNGIRKNSGTAPEDNDYWMYYLLHYGRD